VKLILGLGRYIIANKIIYHCEEGFMSELKDITGPQYFGTAKKSKNAPI
jgi:hypothetical protein